ncbi:hypothetical protein B0H11DRAFT_2348641 [Mycena galericulata]|nr:hypothetical protein B0H11DRAFT_2348641 [Mycena galericulata]
MRRTSPRRRLSLTRWSPSINVGPLTWEVMVRAELGSGNRDNANALLERLQARCYPEAVYNRISGILIDHSHVLS